MIDLSNGCRYKNEPILGRETWEDLEEEKDVPLAKANGGNIRLDVKWCPVILSPKAGSGSIGGGALSKTLFKSADPTTAQTRIRPGNRALLAVKVRWVRAALRDGQEARVCALLGDGTVKRTKPALVSKADEFCINNEEFCIKNKEFCIENDELCRRPHRTSVG